MARILVVEDDRSMNDILVSTLKECDHNVMSAQNGPDAVNLCQSEEFDLLITGYATEDTPARFETLPELLELKRQLWPKTTSAN